jgi:serine O-acetyltransferase
VIRDHGIDLADTAWIGRRVRIRHQSDIVVREGAVIGDDCLIRQGADIGWSAHEQGAGPALGRQVSLGAGVTVEHGVVIGDGAQLGPNALVSSDVPEAATVMPARSRKLGRSS